MIPNILHFIWLGDNEMNCIYQQYISQWKSLYKTWTVRIWDDESVEKFDVIPPFLKSYYYDNNLHVAFKSDILRYCILYKFGGLYFDVDFEPLKIIPEHFFNFEFLGGIQNNNEVSNAFLGSQINNKLLYTTMTNLPISIEEHRNRNELVSECIYKISGPEFLNNICLEFFNSQEYFFFSSEYFYPYWFTDVNRRNEDFRKTSPLSYAVHHWASSWKQKI